MKSPETASSDDLAEQRELHRREREALRIANLPDDQRDAAIDLEAAAQAAYQNTRQRQRPNIPPASASRHMDDVWPGKTLFCPVQGCPRSKGGQGFKTKGELIRHGITHQTPGYMCPFCPDRDHKYPRPDNLKRYDYSAPCKSLELILDSHVRVFHPYLKEDDPQLQAALALRLPVQHARFNKKLY
jgi:hypothetical protein